MISHPVGLAAGFDKNAEMVEELFGLGFPFVEVGSVTAFPYGGNSKPRLARLPRAQSLVNRMGLNSHGAAVVAMRVHKLLNKYPYPIAVNIARTNDERRHEAVDYVDDLMLSFECFKTMPLAYITFNLSCPNTNESIVTEIKVIDKLLSEVKERNHRKIPIMLKLSPDSSLSFLSDLTSMINHKKFEVAGYITGNTSSMNIDASAYQNGKVVIGGVSGALLHDKAVKLTKVVRSLSTSKQIVIGAGGISDGQSANDFLDVGADFIQLYTGLVYKGPRAVIDIAEDLLLLNAQRQRESKCL